MNLKGAFHLIGTPLYSWYSYPQNQCHLLMFICNEILYMSPLKMSFHTHRDWQLLVPAHKQVILIEYNHYFKGIYRIRMTVQKRSSQPR